MKSYYVVVKADSEIIYVTTEQLDAESVQEQSTIDAVNKAMEELGYDPDEDNESARDAAAVQAGVDGETFKIINLDFDEEPEADAVVLELDEEEYTYSDIEDLCHQYTEEDAYDSDYDEDYDDEDSYDEDDDDEDYSEWYDEDEANPDDY